MDRGSVNSPSRHSVSALIRIANFKNGASMRDQTSQIEATRRQRKDRDLPGAASGAFSRNRRSMLKGAAGTLPAILTLQSGAALARSSSVISSTTADNAKDAYGRTMCLDKSTIWKDKSKWDAPDTLYDLGNSAKKATPVVQCINERDYVVYDATTGTYIPVTEGEMCYRGGTFSWDGGIDPTDGLEMQQLNVNYGMLVSGTAITSVSYSDRVQFIDM